MQDSQDNIFLRNAMKAELFYNRFLLQNNSVIQ